MTRRSDLGSRCTRREFVGRLGAGAVALGVGACLPGTDGVWPSCAPDAPCNEGDPLIVPPASSRVVEVRSRGMANLDQLVIEPGLVPSMLTAGLKALTGLEDEAAAWAAVLPGRGSGEIVGLKVNTLSPYVPTSLPLVSSLVDSLTKAEAAPAEELLVWDRFDNELIRSGLTADAVGCPVRGTLVEDGSGLGPGYEAHAACLSGRNICMSTLLTQQTQHTINVSVLKNHSAAGFTGCLKNHYGSFSNPGDFHEGCEQHIARLNTLPQIASKARLHVMDTLIGVIHGDTNSSGDCGPGRLLLGFDPVALDQRGMELRDELLALRNRPAGTPGEYLPVAEALGLGTRSYELVTVETE